MHGSLRLVAFVAFTAAISLTSCGKKKLHFPRTANQEDATPAAPAPESSPGNGAVAESQPPAESSQSPAQAAAAPPAAGAIAAASGVSPALVESDAALMASGNAYDAWFRAYKLDLDDPTMLDADPDGDGASNRDEFMANTNPRDPNSHPKATADASSTVARDIRLKEFNEVRVPVVLEAVDGEVARIKHLDDGESEAVRPGQTLKNLGLKVEKVQARRRTDKNGEVVDGSQVTLEDPATKERILLVKDMPSRSGATYAVLVSPDGKTTRKVRQGETFAWPQDGGPQYTVIDLRANQAVVQELETGRMLTIPKR